MSDAKQDLIEQLQCIPAEKLATLLADLAQDSESVAKAVQMFLLRGDPKGLARTLNRRIRGIARRKGYIDYRQAVGVAQELEAILDAIERDLIPVDPLLALPTLTEFIKTDTSIIGQGDDSSGMMGWAYRHACELFGLASTAAGRPREAEELFLELSAETGYGTRDRLFEQAVRILSEEALQRIVTQWRFRAQGESPERLGSTRSQLAAMAESMGDPELYEEASLMGRPADAYPVVALRVAKVYLDCGRPKEALAKMPANLPTHYASERRDVLVAIHSILGNTAEVSGLHWEGFVSSAGPVAARRFLETLPEGEREKALERMFQHVLAGGYSPLTKAAFFAEMGDPATAAELVLAAQGQFNGENYPEILDLIKLIERTQPLAASVLYRAVMEAVLKRAIAKYYPHAVRYAKQLAKLAEGVSDWRSVIPHEDYWRAIQQTHARKQSFWSRLNL